MIRAVGNNRLFLSKDEYEYYLELIKFVDKSEFNSLFISDNDGNIIFIQPDPKKPVSLVVLFFLMNVMFNQKLRKFSDFSKRIESLEDKINKL